MYNVDQTSDLLINYSHDELTLVYKALDNPDLELELYESGSSLLIFFVDIALKDKLLAYFLEY